MITAFFYLEHLHLLACYCLKQISGRRFLDWVTTAMSDLANSLGSVVASQIYNYRFASERGLITGCLCRGCWREKRLATNVINRRLACGV